MSFTRECLVITVDRRLTSQSVLAVLADLTVRRGVPDHIRSDNGPEFAAHAVRDWIAKVGAKTLFIETRLTLGERLHESFNGKLRDELLNIELFNDLREVKVLIERWRRALQHRPSTYIPRLPAADD